MDVLRTYRALLGNGPLTRLLAGEFVSAIGDWLYLVALLILTWSTSAPTRRRSCSAWSGRHGCLPYVFLSVPGHGGAEGLVGAARRGGERL